MTSVRTRFAPSPTGYMHIGGMRTALFNWLWSRHNGGTFVLRIDDTDQQRNLEEALAPILQAFRWLGLDWDEGPEKEGPYGPYRQSERTALYRQAAERLLAEKRAYRCFDTSEQIQADRAAAEREKRPYLNSRRSLELSDQEVQARLEQGDPHTVRFLVPRDGKVAIDDHVRGHVEWDAGLIPDPVIVRSDGSALYNFATAVDDGHMRISHVIRAEEHLSNTPVQVLLHQALGNPLPEFAHIPFVTAPGTTKKLSKREIDKYRRNPQFRKLFEAADRVFPQIGLGNSETLNPVMVEYYEKIGYLPEAVFNALARTGWSLDDKTEIMSRETVIISFTLDRVVKKPAGFDTDKLASFQAHWMGQRSLEEKVDGCLPYLRQAGVIDDPADAAVRDFAARVISAMDERLKVSSDILDYREFFEPDGAFSYDEKDFEKRLRKQGAAERLARFKDRLAEVEPFDAQHLDRLLHEFVEAEGIKIGDIIHALRVAVTGRGVGFGVFESLELLGRNSCLARIDRALERV